MKYLLSILRILMGVFGGVFLILTTLLIIFSFTYKPKPFKGSGLFPDFSGIHIVITGYGMIWSGIISLFFIILYFTLKYFFKNKIKSSNNQK